MLDLGIVDGNCRRWAFYGRTQRERERLNDALRDYQRGVLPKAGKAKSSIGYRPASRRRVQRQAPDQGTLRVDRPRPPTGDPPLGDRDTQVLVTTRLGGLLREYSRAAA